MAKRTTVLPNAQRIHTLLALLPVQKKQIPTAGHLSQRTVFTILAGRSEVARDCIEPLVAFFNSYQVTQTTFQDLVLSPGPVHGIPTLASDYVPIRILVDAIEEKLIDLWQPRTIDEPPSFDSKIFVCGPPGTGKTTSSVFVAQSKRIRSRFHDGLIFVRAGTQPNLTQLQENVLSHLNSQTRQSVSDLSHGLQMLRDQLSHKQILIILDDVFQASVIEALDAGAALLITTQRKDIAERYSSEPLLTENLLPSTREAFSILQKASATARVSKSVRDRFFEIIQMCQVHPYAIHTVGRMKRIVDITWEELVPKLRQAIETIRTTERITYPHGDLLGPFAFSVDLLPIQTRQKLLQLSVTPGSSTLTPTLLELLWSDSEAPPSRFQAHLNRLLETSLLFESGSADEPSYRLHTLVHALLVSRNPPVPEHHTILAKRYEEKFQSCDLAERKDSYYFFNYPFHLSKAGLKKSLQSTLLDIDWLQEKVIRTRDISGICRDMSLMEGNSGEVLSKAISLSARSLLRDPHQLPVQLLGRTVNLTEFDPAVAIIHAQIEEASSILPLLPKNQCLLSYSDNILSAVLSQHSQVECLCVSDNLLVSGGMDFGDCSYLQVWHIEQQGNTTLLEEFSRVGFQQNGPTALWAAHASPSVFVGTQSGRIAILDPRSECLTYFKQSHDKRVRCFTEIDGILLSGSDDGHLNLWDPERGRLLGRVETQSDMVTGLAASPTGVVAATGADTVVFYELNHFKLTEIARHRFANTKLLTALETSGHPDTWFIGTSDGMLIRYNLSTQKEQRIQAHSKIVLCLFLCPKTAQIVSSSIDPPIQIWDSNDLSQPPTAVQTDRRRSVKALSGTDDGRTLFAGCSFSEIKVLARSTRSQIPQSDRHHGAVAAILADRKERRVISISQTGELYRWDCQRGAIASNGHLHLEDQEVITCAVLSRDGSRLWIGTSSGTIREYTTRHFTLSSEVKSHQASITALVLESHSQFLVTAGRDHRINALALETRNTEVITKADAVVPTSLAMSPAGELLSGWNNGSVMRLPFHPNADRRAHTQSQVIHQHEVTCLCFHATQQYASASADGCVHLCSTPDLQVQPTRITHGARITHLTSLSDSLLLVADDTGQCNIWNTVQSQVAATYFGDSQFTCGTVHEDCLCLGDSDGFIHILQRNGFET